jgi:hypothetical protein
MNRDSVNTVLLITCLAGIVYVGYQVSQRPTIDEIDARVDTIVESRQTINRVYETSRLKRYIRETLDDSSDGPSDDDGFAGETIEVDADGDNEESVPGAEQADPATAANVPDVEGN